MWVFVELSLELWFYEEIFLFVVGIVTDKREKADLKGFFLKNRYIYLKVGFDLKIQRVNKRGRFLLVMVKNVPVGRF